MLLTVTIVLFLISTHAHASSSIIIHGEEQNAMNKNHLLESLQREGSPSPSTINQKVFVGHNVSPLVRRLLKVYVAPSAPNPSTYNPPSTISQKTLASQNASTFLGLKQENHVPSSLPKGGTSIP